MSKNKFTTYLLYAVGEIILVVIGILIAVNINEWNAEKKDRLDERNILMGMLAECKSARFELSADLQNRERIYQVSKWLLQQRLANKPLPMDSAESVYRALLDFRFYTPTHPIIDELRSSSRFDLIQSDSVKSSLKYYLQAKDRLELIDQQEITFVQDKMESFLASHVDLSRIIFAEQVTSQDAQFLIENPELGGLLYGRMDRTGTAIFFSDFLKESIDELEGAIHEELKKEHSSLSQD